MSVFLITSGFLLGGIAALYKKNKLNILLPSLVSVLTVGFLVSFNICVGFFKAVSGKEMVWSAVNKEGNFDIIPQERLGEM